MDQTSKNRNGIKTLTFACIVHYFEKSNMNTVSTGSDWFLIQVAFGLWLETVEINGDIDFWFENEKTMKEKMRDDEKETMRDCIRWELHLVKLQLKKRKKKGEKTEKREWNREWKI